MAFSYDPALINDGGLNQMRFSLGDCLVNDSERSAYLSDEEICAALEGTTFKRAQFRLVESLLHRFAYEVNMKVSGASWDLSDRFEQWQKLYNRLKAELEEEELAGSSFGFTGAKQRPPAFNVGMHDWRFSRCI